MGDEELLFMPCYSFAPSPSAFTALAGETLLLLRADPYFNFLYC